jgi:hypothetical protein
MEDVPVQVKAVGLDLEPGANRLWEKGIVSSPAGPEHH